jgi:hypothetical protein
VRAASLLFATLTTTALLAGCDGSSAPIAQLPSPAPVLVTTPAASTTTPDPTDDPTASALDTTSPASAGAVVPDVVGLRLPDAQDNLKASGYPKIPHVDATGQGRRVVAAADWIVRSQVPAGGTPLAPGTPVTLRVGKPSDGAGSTSVTAGVVPEVICMELTTAKNVLEQAGFKQLSTQDATGQGRHQILDRSWIVVSQSARAGARPNPLTGIVLGVVKYGDPTGSSGCQS